MIAIYNSDYRKIEKLNKLNNEDNTGINKIDIIKLGGSKND